MSDLIDRQEAIKAVGVNTWAGSRLNALPSAERHGTWSEDGGELKCSECHSIFFNDIMDMNKDEMPSFCPVCGARMDGE